MRKTQNKKYLLTIAILALALTLSLAANNYSPIIRMHRDPQANIELYVTFHESGEAREMLVGNLITDIGETFLGEAAITGEDANATWAISLSNAGSSSAAWTELPSEVAANGFSRAAATESAAWSNGGDWAINFTYTFTATGTQQLQTAGLQWDSTGESDLNLFAAADFTQTTFEADDTLTIKWVVTINAN